MHNIQLDSAATYDHYRIPPGAYSFFSFVWTKKANRQLLLVSLGGMILQFLVFKWFYPYPDFLSKSYTYINAASNHLDVSVQPIGYSKFLAAFHFLTRMDWALAAFQYLLLEGSLLFFFFSILLFYSPTRKTRIVLFIFLLFNPLILYLSNYVSGEPMFIGLSLLWFTNLLWLIQRPVLTHIIIIALLIFLCVVIENHSYYYLFVTIIAYLLSSEKPWIKLLGIITPFLLVLPFVIYTRGKLEKMTGTPQLSLSGGWQLANNALYLRSHIALDSIGLPSPATRELDRMVRTFYKRVGTETLNASLSGYTSNFFIENSRAPLKQYLYSHSIANDQDWMSTWGKSSAVFDQYGSWLIRHNSFSYAHYYLLPNIGNYLLPPLESLESYNGGKDEIAFVAQDWFGYPTPIVTAISMSLQEKILRPVPYLFFMIQVLYVGAMIWWLVRKKHSLTHAKFNRALLLGACFWVLNFSCSVFTSPIVMRYQVLPLFILGTFALILIALTDKKEPQDKEFFDISSATHL